jgi:hypothetical protein
LSTYSLLHELSRITPFRISIIRPTSDDGTAIRLRSHPPTLAAPNVVSLYSYTRNWQHFLLIYFVSLYIYINIYILTDYELFVDVHEMNAYRLTMSVCSSVRMIQLENSRKYFDKIRYGSYAIGGYPKIVNHNFLHFLYQHGGLTNLWGSSHNTVTWYRVI